MSQKTRCVLDAICSMSRKSVHLRRSVAPMTLHRYKIDIKFVGILFR